MHKGRATPANTAAYAKKVGSQLRPDFYNTSRQGLTLASVGFGTYKGEVSESGDQKWNAALEYGIERGVNVLDTAIRYRGMRSEKMISRVLEKLIAKGSIEREEIFISTKGGVIGVPEGCSAKEYVEAEIIRRRGVAADKIYQYLHCLEPVFLNEEIQHSREALNLETLDCYFLHNPELNFAIYSREEFYHNLYAIFEMLEKNVSNGAIAAYGLASWNGFRRRQRSAIYLDLEKIYGIAKAVAGDGHHFQYLELPLSIGMPFIYNSTIIAKDGSQRRFLELARELNLNILSSASVYEGNLAQLFNLARLMRIAGAEDSPCDRDPAVVSLPISENSVAQLFEVLLSARTHGVDLQETITVWSGKALGIYPSALNIVRSIPEVVSALVGMSERQFAVENLTVGTVKKITPERIAEFFKMLHGSGA